MAPKNFPAVCRFWRTTSVVPYLEAAGQFAQKLAAAPVAETLDHIRELVDLGAKSRLPVVGRRRCCCRLPAVATSEKWKQQIFHLLGESACQSAN